MTAGEGKDFSKKIKEDFKVSGGLDFFLKKKIEFMGLDFEAFWSRWMLTIADAQLEDSGSASASENYIKIFFRDINMLTI